MALRERIRWFEVARTTTLPVLIGQLNERLRRMGDFLVGLRVRGGTGTTLERTRLRVNDTATVTWGVSESAATDEIILEATAVAGPGSGTTVVYRLTDSAEPGDEGPPGPPGRDGVAGAQGPSGPALFFLAEDGQEGERGPEGRQGVIGATGSTGPQGQAGPALFFLAEDGQEGERGPQGGQGAQGVAGSTGPQGQAGPALFFLAEDGEEGDRGPIGPAGPAGAQGSAGANGATTFVVLDGEPGDDGMMGPRGATGATGPAGGGGGSATTIEVNLGATAQWQGRFTITDAGISGTSKVLCWQAPGPYTGKGTRADEAEMQPVMITAVNPASGTATAYWQTPPLISSITRQQAGGQPASTLVPGMKDPSGLAGTTNQRLGKVRGNVKFTYLVFS